MAIGVFVLFIIGFAIGYGSHRVNSNTDSIKASPLLQQPNYVFVSNTSGSCPALSGERLLTTMSHGDSFEGKVNFECKYLNIYYYFGVGYIIDEKKYINSYQT